ncbi:MAG: hypothetical protein KBC64_02810 [Simkaniaceae bacterium]|nr:hypothetical protein [Simkaniaceae bacterium]
MSPVAVIYIISGWTLAMSTGLVQVAYSARGRNERDLYLIYSIFTALSAACGLFGFYQAHKLEPRIPINENLGERERRVQVIAQCIRNNPLNEV